jgi:hypothetical protein
MAKEPLLSIVQSIMSDMNSDEVNSISDTIESLQVAQIVKDTYFYLAAERERPWTKTLFTLEAATTAFPTKMRLPDSVESIDWIKYDKAESGATSIDVQEIKYLSPDDFLDRIYHRSEDESNIETYTDSVYGVKFLIQNDAAPSYWTTFDDEYIIFDSYDNTVDSNLQQSKSVVYAFKGPTWTMDDTFVPDVPEKMYPLFVSMSKAACFETIKQVTSGVNERRTRKLTTRMQKRQRRIDESTGTPDYGRK